MLDLNKQQELAKSMSPQSLQAAAQGQHPMIAPYIAAARLASAEQEAANTQQGQAAAQAPQQTTIQQIMATRQQEAMRQQQAMQQMQQQMSRPVMAAQGGIMSATPRQPAGMAALIRQHLANPVKAADGGLMAIKRFSEGGEAQSMQRRIADLEAALKRYEKAGSDTRSIRQALLHAKSRLGTTEMPREVASLESRYPPPPAAPPTPEIPQERAKGPNDDDPRRHPPVIPPEYRGYPPKQPAKAPPTAAQPAASAATGPGIPSLTTQNVDSWGADLRNDYKQIGTNAPNVEAYREHEARRQAAQRALFEAQQGGSEFSKVFGALAGAGVLGSRDGSAAARGLMGLHGLKEQQRVARPEFDLQMTEQDIKEAQRLMEMERGYKDKAVGDRAGVSRPMAEQEARDAEAMRRELSRQEDAARAAGVAFDREQAMEEIKHKYRMREQAARPSGVGSGVDGMPKEIVAAWTQAVARAQDELKTNIRTKHMPAGPAKDAQYQSILRRIVSSNPALKPYAGQLLASEGMDSGADPGKVDTSNPLLR